jgi:hypothetical protein
MSLNLVLHYRAGHRLQRHVADTAAVQCTDLGAEGLILSVPSNGETGTSCSEPRNGLLGPFLGKTSTSSFPLIPLWPGTHRSVNFGLDMVRFASQHSRTKYDIRDASKAVKAALAIC